MSSSSVSLIWNVLLQLGSSTKSFMRGTGRAALAAAAVVVVWPVLLGGAAEAEAPQIAIEQPPGNGLAGRAVAWGLNTTGQSTIPPGLTGLDAVVVPADIVISAANASGTVVNFSVSATDLVDPAPLITAAPASGSVFPIGKTGVQLSATDSSGNVSRATFSVTVRDLVAPQVTLSTPKPGQKLSGATVVFSGRATDDRAVARVEVSLNGGAAQVVMPGATSADFQWSLSTVPEAGLNTALVTAYDRFENPSAPILCTFFFVNLRPAFAGSYNGLLRATPASLSPIDHEGLVNLSVLASGAFSAKVTVGGTVFALKGVFLREGDARFGAAGTPTLELFKKAGALQVSLGKLALRLDRTPGAGQILGSLDQGQVRGALLGRVERALYTAKKNPAAPLLNVPAAMLNPRTDKGQYTAIFPAGAAPENGAAIPQGHGWARMSLSAGGAVRLTGRLADGSPISYGNVLFKNNELPVFIMLYGKTGLLSGAVVFDPTQAQTDASGAAFKWYKPVDAAGKIYPDGWPEGISGGFAASKFVKPVAASGLNALGISGAAAPSANAVLVLSEGFIDGPEWRDLAIAANNKVTALSGGRVLQKREKISIAPATGAVSGSFGHPLGSATVPFSGVVFQKTHSAADFFLYSPAKPAGGVAPSGVSGLMQILGSQ